MNIQVSDRNSSRTATIEPDSIPAVVGRWIADDSGALTVEVSPNITALARALRRGDWAAVHAIADHLAIDVDVLA